MTPVRLIPDHIKETLLTPEEKPQGKVKVIDIVNTQNHILTPPKWMVNKNSFEKYSEVLFQRLQKYPDIFVQGVLKLLKYHQEGVQIVLDDKGKGYADVAKTFFVAFASYIADQVGGVK